MIKSKIKRLQRKEFRDAFVSSHLAHGLAHQIRALRTQRGWSQRELAEKLGLGQQSAVARLEDPGYGRLSISTLLKLSSVFDIALSVRFLSYWTFLNEREDLSPAALSAESFDVEIPRVLEEMERASHYSNMKIRPSSFSDFYQPAIAVPSGAPNYIIEGIGTGVNP